MLIKKKKWKINKKEDDALNIKYHSIIESLRLGKIFENIKSNH